MRIVSLNVNGIRSAAKKGLAEWLEAHAPWDVVCVQELKADEADVPAPLLKPLDAHSHFFSASSKKGYSGVGIYCKRMPDAVRKGFGSAEFDPEGRYIAADFGDLTVVSVYFPSGSFGEARQAAKFRFLDEFLPHLRELKASGREIILCGDLNIAHKEIDLKNWKSNQKNSGFLPEERAWLSGVFDHEGFVDVFRTLDERPEQYTWWSNRGQAWAKNVGWRLDYQVATPGVAARAKSTYIYIDERFSDHAPLVIDYEGDL